MLTFEERQLVVRACLKYPKGHGWSYFYDRIVNDPYAAVVRLCKVPKKAARFG
jgi:hypothetical protein